MLPTSLGKKNHPGRWAYLPEVTQQTQTFQLLGELVFLCCRGMEGVVRVEGSKEAGKTQGFLQGAMHPGQLASQVGINDTTSIGHRLRLLHGGDAERGLVEGDEGTCVSAPSGAPLGTQASWTSSCWVRPRGGRELPEPWAAAVRITHPRPCGRWGQPADNGLVFKHFWGKSKLTISS